MTINATLKQIARERGQLGRNLQLPVVLGELRLLQREDQRQHGDHHESGTIDGAAVANADIELNFPERRAYIKLDASPWCRPTYCVEVVRSTGSPQVTPKPTRQRARSSPGSVFQEMCSPSPAALSEVSGAGRSTTAPPSVASSMVRSTSGAGSSSERAPTAPIPEHEVAAPLEDLGAREVAFQPRLRRRRAMRRRPDAISICAKIRLCAGVPPGQCVLPGG